MSLRSPVPSGLISQIALALPVVPDLTEEDPAPKIAGRGCRLDFSSKASRLGFELKHVKSPAHAKAVREEVLVDERTYQEHPYVGRPLAKPLTPCVEGRT
jgi:hypothetical protein